MDLYRKFHTGVITAGLFAGLLFFSSEALARCLPSNSRKK